MRTLATISALAEKHGVSRPTVKLALAKAGVRPVGRKWPADEAAAAITAWADPARVVGHAVAGHGEGGTAGNHTAALARSRAREAEARANKMELQNARLAGSLVSREAVREAGVSLVTAARAALLAIGAKAAPALVGQTDIATIEHIVTDAVRDALGELADADRFNDAILA